MPKTLNYTMNIEYKLYTAIIKNDCDGLSKLIDSNPVLLTKTLSIWKLCGGYNYKTTYRFGNDTLDVFFDNDEILEKIGNLDIPFKDTSCFDE